MTKSIAITRTDYTAAELRELAAGSDDGAQVRRLPALALTLEGGSRTQAAEQCGMQRQTLRDWVKTSLQCGRDCRPHHARWPRPAPGTE